MCFGWPDATPCQYGTRLVTFDCAALHLDEAVVFAGSQPVRRESEREWSTEAPGSSCTEVYGSSGTRCRRARRPRAGTCRTPSRYSKASNCGSRERCPVPRRSSARPARTRPSSSPPPACRACRRRPAGRALAFRATWTQRLPCSPATSDTASAVNPGRAALKSAAAPATSGAEKAGAVLDRDNRPGRRARPANPVSAPPV